MNRYVHGNTAYKYEENGSAARDKRWQTHQAIQQLLHIVKEDPEAAKARQRAEVWAPYLEVGLMAACLGAAVLLLVPVALVVITALDSLCRSGMVEAWPELLLVLSGVVIGGVILCTACKQVEDIAAAWEEDPDDDLPDDN